MRWWRSKARWKRFFCSILYQINKIQTQNETDGVFFIAFESLSIQKKISFYLPLNKHLIYWNCGFSIALNSLSVLLFF